MPDNQPYDDSSLESNEIRPLQDQFTNPNDQGQKGPQQRRLKYLALAGGILILITIAVLGTLAFSRDSTSDAKPVTPITINTQTLDNETLTRLTAQAAPNDTKQQLTVSPATLFRDQVQVQGDVRLDGSIAIGGNASINGTTTMQGAVGITSNLTVNGGLSVGGALTAASVNIGALVVTTVNASGNLDFDGHLIPGGATPTAQTSTIAGGGTIAISGNDTAGTVTLTTGTASTLPGELAIITFRTAFAGTPKVQLTPVNTPASTMDYFVTRSATFFTINTSSATAATTTYVFDYLITQ